MPITGPFTGSEFRLESVAQVALATVRVRFTQDPLALFPNGSHDALNTSQYSLVGPNTVNVTLVARVTADPQSLDLLLDRPLATGSWVLSASTQLKDSTSAIFLTAPTTLPFQANSGNIQSPVSGGAKTDSPDEVLRKHFNPALVGKNWDAILNAISIGDQTNWDNAQKAFNQLFLSLASGKYLEKRAADNGVLKPPDLGIPDALFRELAISVTNSKLTDQAILKVLEVFYGADSVRASCTTELFEPFALQDGDDLTVSLDGKTNIVTVFTASEFAQIGNAKALEIAASLTRSFERIGSNAYAVASLDPSTGKKAVKIYSGALGLSSSVQVTGGRAQNNLQFATRLSVLNDLSGTLPIWNIAPVANTPNTRFATSWDTSGGPSNLHLDGVIEGDYINVFGSEFLTIAPPGNRGSFQVASVTITYSGTVITQSVDVVNPAGVTQSSIQQLGVNSLTFFRPIRNTTQQASSRNVTVAFTGTEIDINLPATTQAVGRGPTKAAYGQINSALMIAPGGIVRDGTGLVVVASTGHGLLTGAQVLVEGAYGLHGGRLNGIYGITQVDANHFAYTTLDAPTATTSTSTATITPMAAPPGSIPGPYLFDPTAGVAITAIEAKLGQQINAGGQYQSIALDTGTTATPALEFPDEEGWLAFGFGTRVQANPVKYLGRLSDSSLLLDFGYKFRETIPSGHTVTLLANKGPLVPVHPESVGSFYATASSSGRIAAASTIDDIVAAGFEVNKTILYPGDRGLGGEGFPKTNSHKLSDIVEVFAGNDISAEEDASRNGD